MFSRNNPFARKISDENFIQQIRHLTDDTDDAQKFEHLIVKTLLNFDAMDIGVIIKHLKIDLLSKFFKTAFTCFFQEEKITEAKLIRIFSNVLTSVIVPPSMLATIFKEFTKSVLEAKNETLLSTFTTEIIDRMLFSKTLNSFLIQQYPIIISKKLNSKNEKTLISSLTRSMYNQTRTVNPSKKVLEFCLTFFEMYWSAKYYFSSPNSFTITVLSPVEQQTLFYIIGSLLRDVYFDFNFSFSSIVDFTGFNLFKCYEHYEVLYKIIHAQPEGLNGPLLISKIIFSFSNTIINRFGFEKLFEIFERWYQIEEISSFRYAFHLSYISLIERGRNAEMTLNFVASIINLESNSDIFINVIKKLYASGVKWNALYTFLIIPFFSNCNDTSKFHAENKRQLFQLYQEDLTRTKDAKLLTSTEDLFIAFWILFPNEQYRLFGILQKWVSLCPSRSPTVKGALINSLVTLTSEDEKLKLELEQLLATLGPLTVKILDTPIQRTINIVEEVQNGKLVRSNLHSDFSGDFCIACRRPIATVDKYCSICQFNFCQKCTKIWKEYQEKLESYCLGSLFIGKKHKLTLEKHQ